MKKSLIYFLSLFVIFPIYALENDDINEDNIIDEIIVSSTKRADEARDVSVTVLALRDADLDRLNISNFDDFSLFLPNVTSAGRGPGQSTMFIRGMAIDPISVFVSGSQGSTPNVAFYLDEQPITSVGRNLDVYAADLERIEVLSGPQGTLFGASAQAGTVRLITKKPVYDVFDAGFQSSYFATKGGDNSSSVEAYINFPVIDDEWSIRGVFYNTNFGGYIDNIFGENILSSENPYYPENAEKRKINNADLVEDDFNDSSYRGFRLASRSKFAETWEVLVQFLQQDISADGVYDFDPTLGDLKVQRFNEDTLDDSFSQIAATISGKIGSTQFLYTGAILDREVRQNADYSGFAGKNGIYVPYYTCNHPLYTSCDDPSIFFQGVVDSQRNTHEIRVATDGQKKYVFTGGIFFDASKSENQENFNYPGYNPSFALNSPISTARSINSSARLPGVLEFSDITREQSQTALFGELTFRILPEKFHLMLGGRFYQQTVDFYGSSNNPTFGSADADDGIDFDSSFGHSKDKLEENDSIYKVTLSYFPQEDVLLFLTATDGFRPGGFNRGGGAASRNPNYPNVPLTYSTDNTENVEFGVKSIFLEGSLRFNANLYQVNWKNIQVSRLDPINISSLTFIDNSAEAKIQGLEADILYYIDDNWTLATAMSFNNSELTKRTSDIIELAPLGSSLPLAPETQWNLRLRYDKTFNTVPMYFQLSTTSASESYSSLVLARRYKQEAYNILNFSIGVDFEDWAIELFARNLDDERAELYYNEMDETPRMHTIRPQNIGLRFKYTFR